MPSLKNLGRLRFAVARSDSLRFLRREVRVPPHSLWLPPPPQTSEMEGGTDVLDLGPDSVVDVGTQTNTYICSICEYRGRDSFALRRHINSLHKAK